MRSRNLTPVLASILLAVSVTQPVRAGVDPGDGTPAALLATRAATRTAVQDELLRLGRDIVFAGQLAGELTDEDLAVLFANPRMMQPAGAYSAQSANLMAALLLLGGIIALAAASDGSVLLFN